MAVEVSKQQTDRDPVPAHTDSRRRVVMKEKGHRLEDPLSAPPFRYNFTLGNGDSITNCQSLEASSSWLVDGQDQNRIITVQKS